MKKTLVAFMLFLQASYALAADNPLVFGVLNQQSPQLTAERWNPILQYLQDSTGLQFVLRMGPTVQATDAMMAKGVFDLVFTNHNFQPEFDGVYKVIARWGDRPAFGVIAVPEESPIRSLKDLANKKVAYPSTSAFLAYSVPKAALRRAAIREQEVLAGNQDGALAQLAAGLVDAVAVNSRFLTQYAARKKLRYREIYTSDPYPDLAVVAHPRLNREEAQAIQRALLAMRNDPKAAAILERNQFSGFSAASDKDYEKIRKTYRLLAD